MPHVRVAVRCRPPLSNELQKPCGKLEVNEVEKTIRVAGKQGDKVFKFDTILSETARQEDVFETCSPMIDHALDGLHSTIFAYGQTGSGKTYSMEGLRYDADHSSNAQASRAQLLDSATGDPNFRPKVDVDSTPSSEHGVMLRTVAALFDRANARMKGNPNIRYKIHCSYYQLYNEKVSDLLNPSSNANSKEGLKIRWSRDDHFSVQNLFIFECDDAEQVRELVMMGVKNKTMGSHAMNLQSSRSHCLFTLYVTSWDPDNPDYTVKSQLSVVDLAGSEKLTMLSTNPSKQLVQESIEINTSLLSLGKVITALATNSKGHIPYRDSKLTKLLKHALGGNSMTMMLACVSPLDSSIDETLSTLLYAGRARNITTEPRVNEDSRSRLIRQLREEISALKMELDYYRGMALEEGGAEADFKKKSGAPPPLVGRRAVAGGDSNSATPTKQRPATDPNSGKNLDLGDVAGGTSSSVGHHNDILSEKLISSCAKLKDVIGLNAQLRKAFDKINEVKLASEKREVELNAENIALRERIEMLESIAMQEVTLDAPAPTAGSSSGAFDDSPGQKTKTNRNLEEEDYYRSTTGTTGNSMRQSQGGLRSSSKGPARKTAGAGSTQQRGGGNPDDPYGAGYSFKDKLSQYNKKYHNPVQSANYESYYGAAQKSVSSRANQQLSSDIERLVKKVGNPHAKGMVPESLQGGGSFGSLAFGGGGDSVDYEERRRQRELKRQQLQEKHMTMQMGSAPDADEMKTSLPSAAQILNLGSTSADPTTPPRRIGSSSGYGQQATQQRPAPSGIPGGTGASYRQTTSGGSMSSGGYAPAPLGPVSSGGRPGSGYGGGGGLGGSGGQQQGPTTTSSGNFSYLSQEESRGLFTPEQLALLRSRATGGSSGGAPQRASSLSGSGYTGGGGQFAAPGSSGSSRGYGPPPTGAPALNFASSREGTSMSGTYSGAGGGSTASSVTQRLLEQMKNAR